MKLELYVFNENNIEYFRRLNDVWNDMEIMIQRGELDEEKTHNFISGVCDDINNCILLCNWYMRENRRNY